MMLEVAFLFGCDVCDTHATARFACIRHTDPPPTPPLPDGWACFDPPVHASGSRFLVYLCPKHVDTLLLLAQTP